MPLGKPAFLTWLGVPRELLGLELNLRATIADVVLRIGYLQWHICTHSLTDDHNREQQAAALHHGPPVPRLDAQG
jgi:hypothetical protein